MRIRYTETTFGDVRSIFIYLAQEAGEDTAGNVLSRVHDAIQSLMDFPEQGRVGRVAATRELVVPRTPFIAAYRILKNEVQILAIIHGARRWPDSFN